MTRTTRGVSMLAVGAALALFMAPLACGDRSAEPEAATPGAVGQAEGSACAPNPKAANLEFTLEDMNGQEVHVAGYKGKVILLNFWATWCGPCKAEIPGFVELQAQYKNDLVVLGFSVDDPVEKVKAFAEQYAMNYPVLIGLGREDVQEAFGPIWGIPTSFVIGRDGRVCKKHMGMASKDQIEREIKGLL